MECLYPPRVPINNKWATVPCGKCFPCLKRKASGWAVRLMAEQREAKTAHFITLTYETKHLPFNMETGKPCLEKSHLQKFFKRLRKHHQHPEPIIYYAVGEYGDQYERPHYHVILFNSDIPTIEKSWKLGHVYYGTVTMASVMYTLSYMLKEHNPTRTFRLSSKHLGMAYLTPEAVKWHTDDLLLRYFAPGKGNKRLSLPRYLKQLIYTDDERQTIVEQCADGNLWQNVDKNNLEYLDKLHNLRNKYPQGYKPKIKHLTF